MICSWHPSPLHLVAAYYINKAIFQVWGRGGVGGQEGKEEQLCCWDGVQVFIPCFICAEFLEEKNCLSVCVRTLCVPWSSQQTLLFVVVSVKAAVPICCRAAGGGEKDPPNTRGFEELGLQGTSASLLCVGKGSLTRPLWGRGDTVYGKVLLSNAVI